MKDTNNITIALLLASAGILTAMLVGAYLHTPPAAADTPARLSQYIAVTGAWSGSRDFLYLTDIVSDRMHVYAINQNTRAIELIDDVDLKRLFRD
jgi:hypothetical protein